MAKTSAAPKSSAPASRSTDSDSSGGHDGPAVSRDGPAATNKPAHTIRYRNLKATIWLNTGQNGAFHSVTFTRSYQDKDDQWHDVTTFNTGDLPTLAKLVNDAHSWISWCERRAKDEAAKSRKGASS